MILYIYIYIYIYIQYNIIIYKRYVLHVQTAIVTAVMSQTRGRIQHTPTAYHIKRTNVWERLGMHIGKSARHLFAWHMGKEGVSA